MAPMHSGARHPILKRYLMVPIDPRADIKCSTSSVEGNQSSCSLGIKLLLVQSSHQSIEQTQREAGRTTRSSAVAADCAGLEDET